MNKKEIIQFGGPTLAFTLTSFVLKDLYKIDDMMAFTIILVVAGLACLGVGLLRHKSARVQLTFSLVYCVLIMIFAYFYLRPRDTQRDLRADLNGKWQTQSYGTERTPLTIEFLGTDSVRLIRDNHEARHFLEVKGFNHYFILNNDDEIVADWRIDEVHSNRFKVTLLEEDEVSVEFERVGD